MKFLMILKAWYRRSPQIFTGGGLVLLNLLLFFPILRTFFISDDFDWLHVAGSGETVLRSFIGNYYGEHGVGGTFRPLVAVFFYLGRILFGLNPWGYHLVQVIIHALAAFFVYLIGRLIFERQDAREKLAIASAVIFSLLPSHVEAVAWIAAIGDPLATLLYLASFYFYIRYARGEWKESRGRLLLSLILFVSALLTKEIAITLPFVLLAYEILLKKRFGFAYFFNRLSAYLLVLACYLGYRLWAIGLLFGYYRRDSLTDVLHLDQYAQTLANVFANVWVVGQLRINFGNALVQYWYVSIIVLAAMVWGMLRLNYEKRNTYLFLLGFWLINVGLVLPLSLGILNDEGQRYGYLPSVAFCLWIAWLGIDLFQRYRWRVGIFAIGVMVAWGGMQQVLTFQWREAGKISQNIYNQLPNFDFKKARKTYVVGLPDSYLNAQVFRNGFLQALALQGIEVASAERVPVYVRLNDLNRDQELFGQRIEKEDGFLWQTRDLQYVVTGNATESYPDYHFELWGYNYANSTSNHIRMYFHDKGWSEIKSGDLQLIYFNKGKLRIYE